MAKAVFDGKKLKCDGCDEIETDAEGLHTHIIETDRDYLPKGAQGGAKMNNKLIDLNDHLFAEMDRLTNKALAGEALKEEINRAKAVSNLATQIIFNARLALDAQVAVKKNLIKNPVKMLGLEGSGYEPKK